jgi:23S rRNA (uracil1939-C5)-methyltransferase
LRLPNFSYTRCDIATLVYLKLVKLPPTATVKLEKIIGGGQALATLPDGKKIFVWGGLPEETVEVQIYRSKSSYAEGTVTHVIEPSPDRVIAQDPESYLSTSPWQIMDFASEQKAKADLIAEAFEMHKAELPSEIEVDTDNQQYGYRNKVEFSWYWDNEATQLDLAFYRRGTKGKIPVSGTSLAKSEINQLAVAMRDLLRSKKVEARSLKTLLIRSDQTGQCAWQLYVKDNLKNLISPSEAAQLPAYGGEIIYSDPRSPASKITKRLTVFGSTEISDTILGKTYRYRAESFFQVNLPVYKQALQDMNEHLDNGPTLDLYSGVGSIGLTIGASPLTLVEIDEHAFSELKHNILAQKRRDASAVHAPSEKSLDYIESEQIVIVDPPRAGLHAKLVEKLNEVIPRKIIYLSCNPVTQARDLALLLPNYKISFHRGYNFFPRTPHIEHLVVLENRRMLN